MSTSLFFLVPYLYLFLFHQKYRLAFIFPQQNIALSLRLIFIKSFQNVLQNSPYPASIKDNFIKAAFLKEGPIMKKTEINVSTTEYKRIQENPVFEKKREGGGRVRVFREPHVPFPIHRPVKCDSP